MSNEIPNPDIKTADAQNEAVSKNKPDFILATIGSQINSLADAVQSGLTPDSMSIKDKDYYWKDKDSKKYLQEKLGVKDYKDFSKRYDGSLSLYNAWDNGQVEMDRYSTPYALDTPATRKAGLRTTQGPGIVFNGVTQDNSSLTSKRIAQAGGIWNIDGSVDFAYDDSFWGMLANTKTNEVLKENKDGSLATDKYGNGEVIRQDSSIPIYDNSRIIKPWSSEIMQNTFLNGDKQDEGVTSTVFRSLGKILPKVNVLPYVMDATEGIVNIMKSINNVTAESKDFNAGANTINNNLKKMAFDVTLDEMNNPMKLKSIIDNSANIFSQLSGMQAVGKAASMGTEGALKLFGKAAQEAGTLSAPAALIGSQASLLSMSAMASNNFIEDAEKYGIDKKAAAAMHVAIITSYMFIGRLSEMVYGPLEKKVESKLIEDSLKKILPSAAAATKGMGVDEANNVVSQKFLRVYQVAREKLANLKIASPKLYQTALAALTEGTEEGLEDVGEQTIRSSYNTYLDLKGEKKAPTKGRFEDFNMNDFARQVGMDAFYGAIGGAGVKSLGYTKLGKELWGFDSEDPELKKNIIQIYSDPHTAKIADNFVNDPNGEFTKSRGTKNLTYVQDENGNYLPKSKDAPDIAQRFSQNEVNHMFLKSYTEYAKAQVSMLTPEENGGRFDAPTRKLLEQEGEVNLKSFTEDMSTAITDRHKLTEDLKKLESNKDIEADPANYLEKIKQVKEKLKLTNELISDLATGRRATKYFKQSLYNHNPDTNVDVRGNKLSAGEPGFTSFEDYLKQESTYAQKVEQNTISSDAQVQDINDRSAKILAEPLVENLKGVVGSGYINDAARSHIKKLAVQRKLDILAEAKDKSIEVLMRGLNPGEQLTPEMLQAVEDVSDMSELGTIGIDSGDPEMGNYDLFNKDDEETVKFLQDYSDMSGAVDDVVANSTRVAPKLNPKLDPFDMHGDQRIAKVLKDEEDKAKLEGASFLSKEAVKIEDSIRSNIQFLKSVNSVTPRVNNFRDKFKDLLVDTDPRLDFTPTPASIAIPDGIDAESAKTIRTFNADNRRVHGVDLKVKKLTAQLERTKHLIDLATHNSSDPVNSASKKDNSHMIDSFKAMYDKIIFLHDIKEFRTKEMEAIALELQKPTLEFLEREVLYNQYMYGMYKIWNANDFTDVKRRAVTAQLRKVSSGKDYHTIMEGIRAIKFAVEVDTLKFSTDLKELIQKNQAKYSKVGISPTFEQREVITQLMSTTLTRIKSNEMSAFDDLLADVLVSRHGETGEDKPSAYYYRDFISLFGTWGSGKSSFVPWYYLDMLSKNLKDNLNCPQGVITAANIKAQRDNLTKNLTDRGIEVVSVGNNGDFTVDDLIKSLKDDADFLKKASIVALYDEATFIPKDKVIELHKELQRYNDPNNRKNRLQVVFIGDNNQQGHIEASEGGSTVTDENIGNLGMFPGIVRTTYIASSQRTGSKPVSDFLDETIFRRSIKGFKNDQLLTSWGTDSAGKLSGVRLSTGSQFMDPIKGSLNSWLENLKTQLVTDPAYTAMYITDRPLDSPEVLKVVERIKEKGLTGNVRVIEQGKVQGQEAKTIIVDFKGGPDGALMFRDANSRTIESSRMRTIGTSVSRVEDFVLMVYDKDPASAHYNTNREWKSSNSANTILQVDIKLTPEFFEALTKQTLSQLDKIIGALSGNTPAKSIVAPIPATGKGSNSEPADTSDSTPSETSNEDTSDLSKPENLSSIPKMQNTSYDGENVVVKFWEDRQKEEGFTPFTPEEFKKKLDSEILGFADADEDMRQQFLDEHELLNEFNDFLKQTAPGGESISNELLWFIANESEAQTELSTLDREFDQANDYLDFQDDSTSIREFEEYDVAGMTMQELDAELEGTYGVTTETVDIDPEKVLDEFKPKDGEYTIFVAYKTIRPAKFSYDNSAKSTNAKGQDLEVSLLNTTSGNLTADELVSKLEELFGGNETSTIRSLMSKLNISSIGPNQKGKESIAFRYNSKDKTLEISPDKVLEMFSRLYKAEGIPTRFLEETFERELIRAVMVESPKTKKLDSKVLAKIAGPKFNLDDSFDAQRYVALVLTSQYEMDKVKGNQKFIDAISDYLIAKDPELVNILDERVKRDLNPEPTDGEVAENNKLVITQIPKVLVAEIAESKLDNFFGMTTAEIIKREIEQAKQRATQKDPVTNPDPNPAPTAPKPTAQPPIVTPEPKEAEVGSNPFSTNDPTNTAPPITGDGDFVVSGSTPKAKVFTMLEKGLEKGANKSLFVRAFTWITPYFVKNKDGHNDFYLTHRVKAQFLEKQWGSKMEKAKVYLRVGNLSQELEHGTGKAWIHNEQALNKDSLYLYAEMPGDNHSTNKVVLAVFPVNTYPFQGIINNLRGPKGVEITAKFKDALLGNKDIVVSKGRLFVDGDGKRTDLQSLINAHSSDTDVNTEMLPPMHFSQVYLEMGDGSTGTKQNTPIIYYAYNREDIAHLEGRFTISEINQAYLDSRRIGKLVLDSKYYTLSSLTAAIKNKSIGHDLIKDLFSPTVVKSLKDYIVSESKDPNITPEYMDFLNGLISNVGVNYLNDKRENRSYTYPNVNGTHVTKTDSFKLMDTDGKLLTFLESADPDMLKKFDENLVGYGPFVNGMVSNVKKDKVKSLGGKTVGLQRVKHADKLLSLLTTSAFRLASPELKVSNALLNNIITSMTPKNTPNTPPVAPPSATGQPASPTVTVAMMHMKARNATTLNSDSFHGEDLANHIKGMEQIEETLSLMKGVNQKILDSLEDKIIRDKQRFNTEKGAAIQSGEANKTPEQVEVVNIANRLSKMTELEAAISALPDSATKSVITGKDNETLIRLRSELATSKEKANDTIGDIFEDVESLGLEKLIYELHELTRC